MTLTIVLIWIIAVICASIYSFFCNKKFQKDWIAAEKAEEEAKTDKYKQYVKILKEDFEKEKKND